MWGRGAVVWETPDSLYSSQSCGYDILLTNGCTVCSFTFSEQNKNDMCLGIHCETVLADT